VNDKAPLSTDALRRGRRARWKLLWKIVAWSGGVLAAVIVLAGIAISFLLRSERFHNYVLRTAQAQASASLGVRVQLHNFAVNFSNLSLDLYGVTVDGATPYVNPPLLQVDHAEVGVRIVSFLHRKWYLDSFRIDRPIAHIFVDARGVSNIPIFKSSPNDKSSTSIFDLAIRHAQLDRGEAYYNDRQSVVAGDLHDVEFQASFESLLQKYSGKLSYTDGHLAAGTFQPIEHSLDAQFDATPTTFHLTQAKVSAGASQLILNATVQNYSKPIVDAKYDLSVDGKQVRQILRNPSVPMGLVRTSGWLHYRLDPNRTLIQSLTVTGGVQSRQLVVTTPTTRAEVTNLDAHYALTNGDASLNDLKLNVLGGYLTASGKTIDIGNNSHSTVNGQLRGVSLAALEGLTNRTQSPQTLALSGALSAQFSAKWGSSFSTLIANTDATIHGFVNGSSGAQAISSPQLNNAASNKTSLPLDGVIHGSCTLADRQIALHDSYLRTAQTTLTLSGVVSDRSRLAVNLQADDLREIETVADLFRTAAPGQPLQPLGLAGTASFTGSVQGSVTKPRITGVFRASSFQVNGTSWKVLKTNIDATPSTISLQHGDLEPNSRGHLTFNIGTELKKWVFSSENPILAEVEASQLNIPDLTKLVGQQLPITGAISASARLHGTIMSPEGSGSVTISNLIAYDQPISAAKVTFNGNGDEAHAALSLQLPSGSVQGKVSIRPKLKTFEAQLDAPGIQLAKLQALKVRNVDMTGELSLTASGRGSFDNPQVSASLQIPKLVVQKQTITNLKVQLNAADHLANALLSTSAVNTNIQAKAQVHLSGDYLADATLDTQAIALQPLIALYSPEEAASLTGQTEVHATLHGPLKKVNAVEAHLNIPVLKMAYGNTIQLAASDPIRVDYKDGIVTLQKTAIRGTDTDMQLQGSIPIQGYATGNAAMSAMLLGTVNLQLAQLFDPDHCCPAIS